MQPLLLFAGKNLLDMTFRLAHRAAPERFAGSGRSRSYAYTFAVKTPPEVTLVPATAKAPRNITLTVKEVELTVTPAGGAPIPLTVSATATGRLLVANGVLSLRQIEVSVDAGLLSALLQEVITTDVLPGIRDRLLAVQMPQLNDVLGDDLHAQVREADVRSGGVLRVGARVGSRTTLAAANDLPTADLDQLQTGSATDARMGAMVSAAALNKVIAENAPPLRMRETRTLLNVAGVRAAFRASAPVLSINNGTGRAKSTVDLTLSAGVHIPFVGWRWSTVRVPQMEVTIAHSLVASGRNALIRFDGVSAIAVDLDLPDFLHPVRTQVRQAVNAMATNFIRVMTTGLAGTQVRAYELPTVLPGTSSPAQITFVDGGLSYRGGSLRSIIRCRA